MKGFLSVLFLRIIEITESGREVDFDFFKSIMDYFVQQFDLSQLVNKLIEDDLNFDLEKGIGQLACFMPQEKLIVVDTKAMKRASTFNLSGFGTEISSFEFLLIHNLYQLHFLFHELKHVLQSKDLIDTSSIFLERFIEGTGFFNFSLIYFQNLGFSLEEIHEKIEKLQNDTYELNPNERMADIFATQTVLGIITSFKDDSVVKRYFSSMLRMNLFRGYNESGSNGPLLMFLNSTHQDMIVDALFTLSSDIKDLYSLLNYGLPISPDDFNRLQQM